jgi:hypothetical protein
MSREILSYENISSLSKKYCEILLFFVSFKKLIMSALKEVYTEVQNCVCTHEI